MLCPFNIFSDCFQDRRRGETCLLPAPIIVNLGITPLSFFFIFYMVGLKKGRETGNSKLFPHTKHILVHITLSGSEVVRSMMTSQMAG